MISHFEAVEFSFVKVLVAGDSFSFSWSTSGFSSCLLLPRCFYICQCLTDLLYLEGSVLLLGFSQDNQLVASILVCGSISWKLRGNTIRLLYGKQIHGWMNSVSVRIVWWGNFVGEQIHGWKNLVSARISCLCHTVLVSLPPVFWPVLMPVININMFI